MRYSFFDDYSEGAHPAILEAVAEHNGGQQLGYGRDEITALAAERIRAVFGTDGDVHFVSGGTQANLVTLASMLRPYEGVIAPHSGHIAEHETGAVEATGHKVITVDTPDGRLTPELVDVALSTHHDEHTVMPRVVYLTQATETGTVYRRDEFFAVVEHAKSRGLMVFVDGARLAMAVGSDVAAMSEPDIVGAGVDAFTVGGTKVGGMLGEAIVLARPELRDHFRYQLKQRGALLAKGRFIGAQFARFFDGDNLWRQLGEVSNSRAQRLAAGLAAHGIEMAHECEINQVFAVFPDAEATRLAQDFGFYEWRRRNTGHTVVRLVCSWATTESAVDDFVSEASTRR